MRHEAIIQQLEQIEQWQDADIVAFIANELPALEYDLQLYTELRREAHLQREKIDPVILKAIHDIKQAIERAHHLRTGLKLARRAS